MQPARWLEILAWSVGLSLLAVYGALRANAEQARVDGIHALREMRDTNTRANSPRSTWQPSSVDQSLWSAARVRAFRQTAAHEPPQGILRIPELRLEVPVYGSARESDLDRGAGHIAGTASLEAPGNIGIAAHRDGFFRKLKDARPGQWLYLETRTRTRRFRVVDLQVVDPSDVTVLAPTATPTVTLVTCYPFYFVGPAPQRFILRAEGDAGVDVRGVSTRPAGLSNQE